MRRKHVSRLFEGLLVLSLLWLASGPLLGASAAGAGEAVQLCYRWQQGETLHYVGRVDIEGLALGPEGIRTSVLSLSMNMPISFHVVAAEANGTARVAVRFGELKLGLGLLGQKLDVTVTGRDISAFFNGTALPASELAELQSELVPLSSGRVSIWW